MRKESFQGILLGIVIMCAVFAFITVAWAALSSTLTINGTATVTAQSWYVAFSGTSSAVLADKVNGVAVPCTNTGDAVCPTSGNLPVIKENTFGDSLGAAISLGTLTSPNDTLTYEWFIVNDGTFDAEIKSITGATAADGVVSLTCVDAPETATGNDLTPYTNFCNYVSATLKVSSDGTTFSAPTVGTQISKKVSSTLGYKKVQLQIKYNGIPTEGNDVITLPSGNVKIKLNTGSGITMNFGQYVAGD